MAGGSGNQIFFYFLDKARGFVQRLGSRVARYVNTVKRVTVVTEHLLVSCQLPFNSITSAILIAP